MNLMATQRPTSTSVFRTFFEQCGASTEPLGGWFPFEELREHHPQLLCEIWGDWKAVRWVEVIKSRRCSSHSIYLKCHEGLTFNIVSTKIWSLACRKGSCKHSCFLNSPGLSVLKDILISLPDLSCPLFLKLCLPGKCVLNCDIKRGLAFSTSQGSLTEHNW